MMIGTEIDCLSDMTALVMCARHLADEIRNIWLNNVDRGCAQWESAFSERTEVIPLLRAEGFRDLQGVDYVFRWWGNEDLDGLAGQVDVIWKLEKPDGIVYYKTWVRVAPRDFTLQLNKEETRKRDVTQGEFIRAFEIWRDKFLSLDKGM